MIVDDRVYGLIVADKSEAAIGYLQGNSIKTAYTMDSMYQVRQGREDSQPRFCTYHQKTDAENFSDRDFR